MHDAKMHAHTGFFYLSTKTDWTDRQTRYIARRIYTRTIHLYKLLFSKLNIDLRVHIILQ